MSQISNDVQLEPSRLYFLDSQVLPLYLQSAKKILTESKQYIVESYGSISELHKQISNEFSSVLVICITHQTQLDEVVHFFSQIKKDIKERFVIPLVFLQMKDDKADELLQKSGCQEVLQFSLNERAIRHKVARYASLLKTRNSDIESQTSLIKKGSQEIVEESIVQEAEQGTVKVIEPLVNLWDFWLIMSKSHAKKIRERWHIEIIGPAPSEGKWERVDGKSSIQNEETRWVWNEREGKSKFHFPNGKWIFFGFKPVYSWVINRWAFVSTKPELSFLEEHRFKWTNHSTLLLRKNSEPAISYFSIILASFDREYQFKEDPEDIQWSSQINSKDLNKLKWNFHDLETDESEWNNKLKPYQEFKFKTGESAMEDCGLQSSVDGNPISILDHSTEGFLTVVTIAMPLAKRTETLRINIVANNMDLPGVFAMSGKVIDWIEDLESKEVVAQVMIDEKYNREVNNIKKSMAIRQEEIFEFFKQAKGIG